MADVLCPKCWRPVPPENLNTGVAYECKGCRVAVVVDAFPAAHRAPAAIEGGIATEGVAVCFYHDHRAAQTACDGCGRYICALCDVPVGKQHLCPECLALRNRAGRGQVFPNQRSRADLAALALAVGPVAALAVPMLGFVVAAFSMFTAPVALALVLVNWRKPHSLVGWSRAWFIVAGVFASLEIVGWLTVLVFAITTH